MSLILLSHIMDLNIFCLLEMEKNQECILFCADRKGSKNSEQWTPRTFVLSQRQWISVFVVAMFAILSVLPSLHELLCCNVGKTHSAHFSGNFAAVFFSFVPSHEFPLCVCKSQVASSDTQYSLSHASLHVAISFDKCRAYSSVTCIMR